MPTLPAISDAEWEVMQVLWAQSPAAAEQVVLALKGRKDWNPRTIKTLLNRLVGKGALAFDTDGKRYLYRPRVKREDCVRNESRTFLSRVFAGRAGEMLCRFVDEVELTRQEIDELKKALNRKGR